MGVDLRQELLAGLVCLQLVNVLHKDTLILEHVTLGPQVEAVVPEGEQSGKRASTKIQITQSNSRRLLLFKNLPHQCC